MESITVNDPRGPASHSLAGGTCQAAGSHSRSGRLEHLARCLSDSAQNVFATMMGIELQAGAPRPFDARGRRWSLSGIIGISGGLNATFVINIDQRLAFAVSEILLGVRPEAVDADVIDLVGELANMIGGNTKERLGVEGLSLGLPTVVSGPDHLVGFDSHVDALRLPFRSDQGELAIELVTLHGPS